MRAMQSFRDIVGIWPSPDVMAAEIGVKPETARKWRQRDSIPAEYWLAIVEAAKARGRVIGLEQFAVLTTRANAPQNVEAAE